MLESTRRVFNIPELLHMMLEQLEIRDLLATRQVCRLLSFSITASPLLALRLFHRDGERAKTLPLNWLPKFCKSAAVQQAKGKKQVVLHVVWTPRRRRQLKFIRRSAFLGAMLLAQPAPDLLRISRICNCPGDAPSIYERPSNGRKLTTAHLARAIRRLPTDAKGNPCVCTSCGADGILRIIGTKA